MSGSTVDAYMTQVEIQEELTFEGEDQVDIARSLIEAHGGRIWGESEVGVGSTFGFVLPVVRDVVPG